MDGSSRTSLPDVSDPPPFNQTASENYSDSAAGESTVDASKREQGCLASLLKFCSHCLAVACGFQLIVGIFLRLTIRDTVPHLAVFFYASPPILLAFCAIVLAIRMSILRRKAVAIGLFGLSGLLMVWWHALAYETADSKMQTNVESPRKILFWNISYAKAGWPAIIDELKKHDADLIGLVEIGHGYRAQHDWLTDAFPDHSIQFFGHGFLLVRGDLLSYERGRLNQHGSYGRGRVKFHDGPEFDVILTDIFAFPFMPRGPAFSALWEVVHKTRDREICLLGDFNTPPDSVFFDPFRADLENAFEAGGSGYHVSWPLPLPVLALDQIWLPPGTTHSAHLYETPHSDHRLIVAEWRTSEP